jgi:hypothetical protein
VPSADAVHRGPTHAARRGKQSVSHGPGSPARTRSRRQSDKFLAKRPKPNLRRIAALLTLALGFALAAIYLLDVAWRQFEFAQLQQMAQSRTR